MSMYSKKEYNVNQVLVVTARYLGSGEARTFYFIRRRINMDKRYEDNTLTAILVDGGFYRRRAYKCFGDKSPEQRANELEEYCIRHLNERKGYRHQLYRIFYYDCPGIL